jgi:type II secretory pathway component GspD/PulD (secretin)
MKLKLIVLGLMGTLVFQQTGMAQDTTGTNGWPTNQLNTAASAPAAEPAPAAATVVVTNVTTVAVDTNAPAVVTGSTTTTTTTTSMAPAPVDTNAPATTAAGEAAAPAIPAAAPATPPAAPVDAGAAPAAAPADSAAAVESAAPSIPLIEFQDVPLTVAIENLARQASINYLLDPKIGYGQPDANGQIKVEPTLSIRWENVTAEQALLALLNNYDLQLVEDPRTKIARVSMKDPTAPPALVTRVVQLKYASVSNMVQSVQAALTDRRSHVFPDVRTSQLIVCATENEQDGVDTLVNELDKPTRQVLIETKLVEVASTPSTAKGVNWSGTVAAQNVSFGNGVLQPSTTTTTIPGATAGGAAPSGAGTSGSGSHSSSTILSTLTQPDILPGGLSWNTLSGFSPAIGFLNADGVQAVLSFLNSSYDAQVVSTPRVVTLDNEAATISVTRQFPVINVTASTAGVSSGSSQISYSNIGTTLIVTPRITANDYIWLKVSPDVSSFFATVTKVIAGTQYQADEFDSRHIDTQVMIPDANTLVMGGLIQDNPTATWNQVPVLGNIPVLGWAFKSESMQMDKDNLIIFITPTIVKDDDFQPATDNTFLASKPMQMREPMNPHSFWDKPEPDWSNPVPVQGEFQNNPVSQ